VNVESTAPDISSKATTTNLQNRRCEVSEDANLRTSFVSSRSLDLVCRSPSMLLSIEKLSSETESSSRGSLLRLVMFMLLPIKFFVIMGVPFCSNCKINYFWSFL